MLMKILIVLMVIIIGLVVAWQPHFINHFRPGFFFEKYKTQEEAKQALLKLHPLGSEVEPLLKTLERAGATKLLEWHGEKNEIKAISSNVIRYRYRYRAFTDIFPKRWRVSIHFDSPTKLFLISVALDQGA